MTPEQYERAREVFHAALDVDAEARGAFVVEACGSDGDLLVEVKSLLSAQERAAGFLEPRMREETDPLVGRMVGRYAVVRMLARGGMGTVYEAEQQEPRRRVALKVVRPGVMGSGTLARFRHEAQVLARMNHPAIAQVYDAGTHNAGGGPVAYFTMELVEGGRDLTTYIAEHGLTLLQRLGMFVRVCDAVAYAHLRGVVHRDLKPLNILVDPAGNPKVLDFGLARLTDSDIAATTMRTEVGQLLGTIPYMSPEQVAGDTHDVDTRADVYALGVILYELLVGRTPHGGAGRSVPEAIRAIREEEPVPPGSVDRSFRGELDTIVGKALEKDREHRYASAADLAADVRRFLANEPIMARPPSIAYTMRKFARRHRSLVTGTIAAVLMLIVGIIGTSVGLFRAVGARKLADHSAAMSAINEYRAGIQAAAASLQAGDPGAAVSYLRAAPGSLRGWEWRYLMCQTDQSTRTYRAEGASAGGGIIDVHPDGTRLVIMDESGIVLFEVATARVLARHEVRSGPERGIRFSHDGTRIAAALGYSQRVRVFDGATLDVLATSEALGVEVMRAAWSLDDSQLAVAAGGYTNLEPRDRCIRLFDARSLVEQGILQGTAGRFDGVEFLPDGLGLIARDESNALTVWDLASRSASAWPLAPGETVVQFCLSVDGQRLATSGSRGVQVWSVPSRSVHIHLGTPEVPVGVLAFSADGRLLYANESSAVVAWDTVTGERSRRRSAAVCTSVAAPRHPGTVAEVFTGGIGISAKAWSFRSPGDFLRFEGESFALMSPDGRLVAHGDPTSAEVGKRASPIHPNFVLLRDAETGEVVRTLDSGSDRVGGNMLAFSPDGMYLARGLSDGVAVWDVAGRKGAGIVNAGKGEVGWICFRPAARDRPGELLIGRRGSAPAFYRLTDFALARSLPLPEGEIANNAAFSADGERVVVVTGAGMVRVLDAETGRPVVAWGVPEGASPADGVAVSPDGAMVASWDKGRRADFWIARTGEHVGTISAGIGGVLFDCSVTGSDARSPRRAFVAMHDGTVRVHGVFWLPGPAGGAAPRLVELLPLRYHTGGGWIGSLSQGTDRTGRPGGRLLAGRDWPAKQYYIWDCGSYAEPGEQEKTPR